MAKIYQPIPGIGSGRGSLQVAVRTRVYQGPDHLLVVQSTGYTEEYKRIFYRDLQYVEVRGNQKRFWQAMISGTFVLLSALLIVLLMNLKGSTVAAQILGLLFLIWFAVNLALGPTCDCFVRTSVQTLQIPAPRRMKKVPVLIGFLRAKIAALEPAQTTPVAA
jgi:hypothetical protein